MVINNRGGERRKPVEIFKLPKTDKEELATILEFINYLGSKDVSHYSKFIKRLSESNEIINSDKDPIAKQIEDFCHHPDQWIENCSWTTAETTVWTFMMKRAANRYKDIPELITIALQKAQSYFREWLNFQRISSFQEYLLHVKNKEFEPDYELIDKIFKLAWLLDLKKEGAAYKLLDACESEWLETLTFKEQFNFTKAKLKYLSLKTSNVKLDFCEFTSRALNY
ncbi:MAG: hypothetical protein H0U49_01155 [Parachlamydiaceae bacterium]|nr:hypothetical protein [Parachlamydiaceae bacterium]